MQAVSVAAELHKRLRLRVHQEDVGHGRFDVLVDGVVIFSKGATGRFPLTGEIIRILRNR